MYRGNGTDKIRTEVRNSYLTCNLNHFLESNATLCFGWHFEGIG